MAQNTCGAANGERYAILTGVFVVVTVRLPVYFGFGGPPAGGSLDFGGAKSTQPSAKCSAKCSATVTAKKTKTRMAIELKYTNLLIPFKGIVNNFLRYTQVFKHLALSTFIIKVYRSLHLSK